jgi:large subunit ribosomal protein L6
VSRIGVQPIQVPDSVTVTIEPGSVAVKGPKGELSQTHTTDIVIKQEESTLFVTRPSDSKEHKSQHGLVRALLANMVNNCANGRHDRSARADEGHRLWCRQSGGR